MRAFDLTIGDIDEFTCSNSNEDWHSDYIQLSPGKLKFRTRVVELPSITLYWNHFDTRMRIREAYVGDRLVFGFILQTENPFLYRGHEFSLNYAVIQHPGTEHYYMVPENIDSLIIHVDRSLITDTELRLCNTVEKEVPLRVLQALIRECQSATRVVQRQFAAQNNEQLEKILRNNILSCLLDALRPWTTNERKTVSDEIVPKRDYLLFRKAEHTLSTMGLGARPSIDKLAEDLAVSKRRLFYAFNKWVGMGPNAYFEVMRLHYVRDQLLADNPVTTRVTDAANELGFNHLGRFSRRYHQFFGEYPSETLRRDQLQLKG
jgi:AraC family ethanolamine operon transcriptional activator